MGRISTTVNKSSELGEQELKEAWKFINHYNVVEFDYFCKDILEYSHFVVYRRANVVVGVTAVDYYSMCINKQLQKLLIVTEKFYRILAEV